MSVTFWIPDAPKKTVPCEWCLRARRRRDDFERVGLHGKWICNDELVDSDKLTDEQWSIVTCDPYCSGEYQAGTLPELNLANGNARQVLALVGLPSEEYGKVAHADIPAALRGIMLAMNKDSDRAPLVRESSERYAFDTPVVMEDADTGLPTITRGVKVIDFGNTDDQTMSRLIRLREVLVAASSGGFDVHWG